MLVVFENAPAPQGSINPASPLRVNEDSSPTGKEIYTKKRKDTVAILDFIQNVYQEKEARFNVQ